MRFFGEYSPHVEAYMFRQFFASHFGDNSAAAGTVGRSVQILDSEVSTLNSSQIDTNWVRLKVCQEDH